MLETSLSPAALAALSAQIDAANTAARRYPNIEADRAPLHTVYGGAHLFRADTARKLGDVALRSLDAFTPDAASLASVFDLPESLAGPVFERVRDKLRREPVEDLRIDFEDGYGARPDAEEDAHAAAAAREVAKGMAMGALPPFLGIRIKSLDATTSARALRTLDVFLTALARASSGVVPAGFVITLPKITTPDQVSALASALDAIEPALGLSAGSLHLELMIETPESLVGPRGEIALLDLYERARGRCVAAHFGAYDYTASCDVTAAHQTLLHPACDFVRHLMKAALARTGIRLSDGATNVLPIPPHRPAPGGPLLRPEQEDDNRAAVHRALRLHFDNVRHALAQGYHQGWDLHPAQLPARYAAVYSFFLENEPAASARLRNFVEKAAQATLVRGVFDDAATGQGLLNFFLRAVHAGALSEREAAAATGLSLAELAGRSFTKIIENRKV